MNFLVNLNLICWKRERKVDKKVALSVRRTPGKTSPIISNLHPFLMMANCYYSWD